jgi:hypothetical protein
VRYLAPTFVQNKKFYTQNVFWGFVTPPPHTKALSKIGKTNLFPHAIQKPLSTAASTVFEGGGDGRGFGGFIFLEMQVQPSHISITPPVVPALTNYYT